MHSRTGHLTGALIGLAAAFAVGYLLLKSAVQLDWIAYATPYASPAGWPPAFVVHGSVSAAGMLLAIAIITGLLTSTRRLSLLAPLLAGLALLAVGLAWGFGYPAQVWTWMLSLPDNLGTSSEDSLMTGIWQLLGGILLVSAAMPWRWTGKLAPAGRDRTGIGVLVGIFCIFGLWYGLQFASPAGFAGVADWIGLPRFTFDLSLLPQAAAATVIGTFAAARWVSPVAAVISGIPLLTVGLLLVVVPVSAARWTSWLVFGAQPISHSSGQPLSMGLLVLVGGLLLVSAAEPWRWRQPSTPPAAAPVILGA